MVSSALNSGREPLYFFSDESSLLECRDASQCILIISFCFLFSFCKMETNDRRAICERAAAVSSSSHRPIRTVTTAAGMRQQQVPYVTSFTAFDIRSVTKSHLASLRHPAHPLKVVETACIIGANDLSQYSSRTRIICLCVCKGGKKGNAICLTSAAWRESQGPATFGPRSVTRRVQQGENEANKEFKENGERDFSFFFSFLSSGACEMRE